MDNLTKTVRRLDEDEFAELLEDVAPNRHSKPHIVLTTIREKDVTDAEMLKMLDVIPSTYYTLKSRLSNKIAGTLAKKVSNPISTILEEVARVPAHIYSNNKALSIRALKELEKQLIEYDMSNELIVVYKTLARLHMYSEEYDAFSKLYDKYVAFSLTNLKAENHFFEYFVTVGQYHMTREEDEFEDVQDTVRKLSNMSELYESHKLFVLFHIVRIYHLCLFTEDPKELQQHEIATNDTLKKIEEIFQSYPLDTIYSSYSFITDFLHFFFNLRSGYHVRAQHYFENVKDKVPDLAEKHILSFHIVTFLSYGLTMALENNNMKMLWEIMGMVEDEFELDTAEVYQQCIYKEVQSYMHFYDGNHEKAISAINKLRNAYSFKPYQHKDIELKMLLGIYYCIVKEKDSCQTNVNSVVRQLKDMEEYENVRTLVKLIRTAFKATSPPKRLTRMKRLRDDFYEQNTGRDKMLIHLRITDDVLKQMIIT